MIHHQTYIMKAKIFLFAAMLFISSSLLAQGGFRIGIKGGAILGKMEGKAFKDEFTLGYQIGGFMTIPLGERVAIQPEVLFNQTNLDTSDQFSDIYEFNNVGNIELRYLSIPIMLNYNLNRYLTLQFGPQFGIMINQDKSLLQNGKDAFKTGYFALAGGLQVNIMKFKIYGRFSGGITNLDNVGDKETWKPQSIQLGVGFTL